MLTLLPRVLFDFNRNNLPAGPDRIAGSKIKSPSNAVNNIISSNNANFAVGMKTPNTNGNTPSPQISDVSIIALAQWSNANRMDENRDSPFFVPRRYQVKKWRVSSTAIPRATLAVMTDPISIEKPSHPIAPNTTSGGNTFGIIATNPAQKLLRTMIMMIVIIKNAVRKLYIKSRRI